MARQGTRANTLKYRDRINAVHNYEFVNGCNYEAQKAGYTSFKQLEHSDNRGGESAKVIETVLENLEKKSPMYYSILKEYEGKISGGQFNDKKPPTFTKYLKEFKKEEVNGMEYIKLKEGITKLVKKILSESNSGMTEVNEIEGDLDDDGEREPTKKELSGIDKSLNDTKEALANAQSKIKELAPRIKKLAQEVNSKIKDNPEGKDEYILTYQTDPDVKEYIHLRKILKNGGLL